MTKTSLTTLLLGSTLIAGGAAFAQDTTLTIESWRNDDLTIWQDTIIPAFEAANPGIKVVFSPSAPTEYNAVLNSKLDAGTAGDLITCRPFDASLSLYDKGQLADLSDLPSMANFSDVAKSGWSTDDGAPTFCVPMASVIHGFIYNKNAFDELGLAVPATEDEFFAALDKIKEDGTYIPMAMGTNDQWEAATMGYQNIGPNYWKGEEGRLALIDGSQKLTDAQWSRPTRSSPVGAPISATASRRRPIPTARTSSRWAAPRSIRPAPGRSRPSAPRSRCFEMGAFPPPVPTAGDTCYISDHIDIAIGMNAASPNAEAARTFLDWVGSEEFATLYANALPGFFPLIDAPVTLEDPLAQEFVSWRDKCKSTIRSTYQILSRGTPNLENETWNVSANVINGTETPEAAAKQLQEGLASWYAPQQ